MSNFTIDFLRISFSCFTRFFKHPSIANSYRIGFKFERDMHKTQLLLYDEDILELAASRDRPKAIGRADM